ncbi:MAG TPA: DUF507 family protein [Myxococcota bacterium]|nr:DUF507 family protein [Myxococcota bacterium]HRY96312.1 DUF507 family protein [Myxococcota bacterium]HSA20806.1 DUF507 family protein [Myxococcota bacterium]
MIYPKLIPPAAREIVKTLMDAGDIEVSADKVEEAQEDFASVLREYHRRDEEISREAKDVMSLRGWEQGKYQEAKRIVAGRRGLPMGDDGLDYVINQMLEFMFRSGNIEEVFAEDHVMRKRLAEIIRKYQKVFEEVEAEVRGKLRHLQEGTSEWDVQYRRMHEQVRRNRGLL